MKVVRWGAKRNTWHALLNERKRWTFCGIEYPDDDTVSIKDVRLREELPNRCGRCFD